METFAHILDRNHQAIMAIPINYFLLFIPLSLFLVVGYLRTIVGHGRQLDKIHQQLDSHEELLEQIVHNTE